MRAAIYLFTASLVLLSACQTAPSDPDNTATAAKAVNAISSKGYKYTKIARGQRLSPLGLGKNSQDVWQRIRDNMAMPIPDQALVNKYRDWFISNPQHLALISQRAKPFLYLIVEEFEQRNLPIELALLPIVESSFNPLAYSRADASGLWQFTSPMASHFGLDMDWWYDGRRDVPAATVAALDMLEYLYQKTDNWLYALAAYNAGEGRLREAIIYNQTRGLSTDFWSLNLPKETQQYVPQLLALADVIKHADKYAITLTPIPNKPVVEIINVGSQIELAVAAELAQMPIARLQQLNPGFNRFATSPNGPHQLIVPLSKADDFKQALADTDLGDRMKWFEYQIKAGDNISAIAKRHQTSIERIKAMNDINGDKIVAGKWLYMPAIASKAASPKANTTSERFHELAHKVSNRPLKIQPAMAGLNKANHGLLLSKNNQYPIEHKVKYADTLWSIAKVYKVSVAQITHWNNMSDSHKLSEGKMLKIWTLITPSDSAAASNTGVSRTL